LGGGRGLGSGPSRGEGGAARPIRGRMSTRICWRRRAGRLRTAGVQLGEPGLKTKLLMPMLLGAELEARGSSSPSSEHGEAGGSSSRAASPPRSRHGRGAGVGMPRSVTSRNGTPALPSVRALSPDSGPPPPPPRSRLLEPVGQDLAHIRPRRPRAAGCGPRGGRGLRSARGLGGRGRRGQGRKGVAGGGRQGDGKEGWCPASPESPVCPRYERRRPGRRLPDPRRVTRGLVGVGEGRFHQGRGVPPVLVDAAGQVQQELLGLMPWPGSPVEVPSPQRPGRGVVQLKLNCLPQADELLRDISMRLRITLDLWARRRTGDRGARCPS